MADMFEDLWEYYRTAALVTGYKGTEFFSTTGKSEQESEQEIEAKLKILADDQAGYSLAWFYNDDTVKTGCHNSPIIKKLITPDPCCADRPFGTGQFNESQKQAIACFGTGEFNESQQQAISTALEHPLSVIWGPPGTGKTRVIVELMYQIYNAGLTAAVVSQNSSAIENIREKLNDCADQEALKKFAEHVAPLGNSMKRQEFNRAQSSFVFSNARGGWESSIEAESFLKEYPIITGTIHSLPKCFADGLAYQYDYVIIDEASQVSPLVGMVAACCAKHLVLVGDPHQLPPVWDSNKEKIIRSLITEEKYQSIDRLTLRDERSFLDLGLQAVGGEESDACVMLNEHYRCHPGIIGFCNKHIYKEKLLIQSKTDGYSIVPADCEVPISVRWFEGNYGESCDITLESRSSAYGTPDPGEKPKKRTTKRNRRQIAAFMEEEWPALQKLLLDRPELTVSVLSPYRGELEELKRALRGAIDSSARQGDGVPPAEALRAEDRAEGAETQPPVDAPSPSEHVMLTLRSVPTGPDGAGGGDEGGKLQVCLERIDDAGVDGDEEGAAECPGALSEAKNSSEPSMHTIHTAQGREFDIVYLLPVDDDVWEWPWSQKKRLVNVAVSRAKQQLRIITSVNLMSPRVQSALLGQSKTAGLPEEEAAQPMTDAPASEDKLFLKKLIDYVFDAYGGYEGQSKIYPPDGVAATDAADAASDGDIFRQFGFVRSRFRSIFDRTQSPSAEEETDGALSDPERRFLRYLCGEGYHKRTEWRNSWPDSMPDVLNEYPLRYLSGDYKDSQQRFDFLLVDNDHSRMTLVLAIEIDGSHHRYEKSSSDLEKRGESDRTKDKFCVAKGGRVLRSLNRQVVKEHFAKDHLGNEPVFTLLRLSTDGSSQAEFNALANELSKQSFVTIEELYAEQLAIIRKARAGESKPIPVVTVPVGYTIGRTLDELGIPGDSREKVIYILSQAGMVVLNKPRFLAPDWSSPDEESKLDYDATWKRVEQPKLDYGATLEGVKQGIFNRLDIGFKKVRWWPVYNIVCNPSLGGYLKSCATEDLSPEEKTEHKN